MDISHCKITEFQSNLLRLGFKKLSPKSWLSGKSNKNSLKKDFERNREKKGWYLAINQPIFSGPLCDCSFLHFSPQIAAFPTTVKQLQLLIKQANEFQIPTTFACGKTGLSGGYANPIFLIDLAQLHYNSPLIQMNTNNHTVVADQAVLVSDLIRLVSYKTQNAFIFPTQPSSSYKLPVRVGGLIATNASGVTSGKLGSISKWIESMVVMTPKGEIRHLTKHDPLFQQTIGGMGLYSIILQAEIRMAPNPQNLQYRIIFGENLENCFHGLKEIQDARIFPLCNEFILSSEAIPGKFAQLFHDNTDHLKVKWAVLLKGDLNIITNFTEILENNTDLILRDLSKPEYQEFMEERSALAIQSCSDQKSAEYLRYPGFEDFLIDPLDGLSILNDITEIFTKYEFPAPVVGYGHLNFRQGKGMLLHLRIPVSVDDLARNPSAMHLRIARLVAFLNVWFTQHYEIHPKAEHSLGIFTPWVQYSQLSQYFQSVDQGLAFLHPAFCLFDQELERLGYSIQETGKKLAMDDALIILERLYFTYLEGKFLSKSS